jgi:hypothetical protein
MLVLVTTIAVRLLPKTDANVFVGFHQPALNLIGNPIDNLVLSLSRHRKLQQHSILIGLVSTCTETLFRFEVRVWPASRIVFSSRSDGIAW